MAKILLVDDDISLVKSLKRWLELDGHSVEPVHDGADALQMLKNYSYDVVVLDWALPSMEGIEILREFRADGGATPIIFLTGHDDLKSKKDGLNSGADDYLTKPFDAEELGARIRSLLRRPPGLLSTKLAVGNCVLEPATQTVRVDGETVHLGKREFAVLEFLMRHPNKCFGSRELLESVWPSDTDASEGSVRACMLALRKKITGNESECIIDTVHGAGYIVRSA
jgi:DNA-binding response OmpR family regulator